MAAQGSYINSMNAGSCFVINTQGDLSIQACTSRQAFFCKGEAGTVLSDLCKCSLLVIWPW